MREHARHARHGVCVHKALIRGPRCHFPILLDGYTIYALPYILDVGQVQPMLIGGGE